MREPGGIQFGALAPRLAEQVGIRAYTLQKRISILKHQQRDADAITRLAVRGLLPDAQVHAARKRLMKNLQRIFASFQPKPGAAALRDPGARKD